MCLKNVTVVLNVLVFKIIENLWHELSNVKITQQKSAVFQNSLTRYQRFST